VGTSVLVNRLVADEQVYGLLFLSAETLNTVDMVDKRAVHELRRI